MYWSQTCPICGKTVHYWANCSRSTNPDYDNYGWCTQGRGQWRKKQFFHLTCLKSIARGKKEYD